MRNLGKLLWLWASITAMPLGMAQPAPLEKKLIEYGWDVPNPAYVREHIREMETWPFDGLIFRMSVGGRVFVPEKWTQEQVAEDFEHLANIEWRRFTDNFLIMYAASDVDWFNDSHWEAVLHNVQFTARAAKIGKCVGVCFDAEPYGTNPWDYSKQPHASTKSFAEYAAQYRRRGAQFMEAIQGQMPKAVVHTLFLFSIEQHLWKIRDPAERDRRLAQEHYGLYPAFINGMLEAAGPGIVLTDGNEGAYYYPDTLSFYRAYHGIRQRARSMLIPENDLKYRTQVQVANALYVDYVFKMWPHATPAEYMTEEERAKWFEHNVYYAMTTSDRYVWLYSERMNWWLHKDLPPGLEDAVRAARAKLDGQEDLGFDLRPLMESAKRREQEAIRQALIIRSAEIVRLGGNPPTIDGDLDDQAWQSATVLEPFLPNLRATDPNPELTQALVTYDAEALYIAIRCREPQPQALKIVGEKRDDQVWLGESVDVFLQPVDETPAYYHFIVNPHAIVWDAKAGTGTEDLSYNPDWSRATQIREAEWTVEIAIPWSALNFTSPQPNVILKANLCRNRAHARQYSTWSQVVAGFVEPENFGTWTLR
ncbi:MAG: sugar-binding protein [Candidatus Zipacnadales bacterium]